MFSWLLRRCVEVVDYVLSYFSIISDSAIVEGIILASSDVRLKIANVFNQCADWVKVEYKLASSDIRLKIINIPDQCTDFFNQGYNDVKAGVVGLFKFSVILISDTLFHPEKSSHLPKKVTIHINIANPNPFMPSNEENYCDEKHELTVTEQVMPEDIMCNICFEDVKENEVMIRRMFTAKEDNKVVIKPCHEHYHEECLNKFPSPLDPMTRKPFARMFKDQEYQCFRYRNKSEYKDAYNELKNLFNDIRSLVM
jgi:hypothetical protein